MSTPDYYGWLGEISKKATASKLVFVIEELSIVMMF